MIWCFFISYLGKLRGDTFLTTDERDEDRGKLSEQFIEVNALPEVMQRAWERKRVQIRELVESKVDTMGNSAEVQKMKKEFEDFDKKGVISRIQIQRLLEEDEGLAEIMETDKAIDVIRRFSIPEFRSSNEEAFNEISVMQENVFTKLEEFSQETELEFGALETLKLVSTGLHDALTEVQNQWRQELTVCGLGRGVG